MEQKRILIVKPSGPISAQLAETYGNLMRRALLDNTLPATVVVFADPGMSVEVVTVDPDIEVKVERS